jgi:hypothetical protein
MGESLRDMRVGVREEESENCRISPLLVHVLVHSNFPSLDGDQRAENGGEVLKDSNPLQRLELSNKTFCQI